jgi:hypothetical protein
MYILIGVMFGMILIVPFILSDLDKLNKIKTNRP